MLTFVGKHSEFVSNSLFDVQPVKPVSHEPQKHELVKAGKGRNVRQL